MPLKCKFYGGTYKYYKDTIEYTNLYPNLILTHISKTVGPYGPFLGEPGSQGYSGRVEVRGRVGVKVKVKVRVKVKVGIRIEERVEVRVKVKGE